MTSLKRALLSIVALSLLAATLSLSGPASAQPQLPIERLTSATSWVWPITPFRISNRFVAPAHEYGAGHRGIDLEPLDDDSVSAPADGTISFVGKVGDRSLLTISHGEGFVTTLEPVSSTLAAGTTVEAGGDIGTIAMGGHSAPGTLHFGVRKNDEYINPLTLFGLLPRAVLLPCC